MNAASRVLLAWERLLREGGVARQQNRRQQKRVRLIFIVQIL